MIRVVSKIAIVGVCLSLVGCGYLFGDQGLFPSQSDSYKKADEQPLLVLPDGVVSDHVDEVYAIPDIDNAYVSPGKFEAPRPEPLLAAAAADAVRIQKLGDETWALVNVAPGQLWPQIRSFLASANWPVAFVDPRTGLIDTAYLPLKDDDREARFRFRVERGVQRGTSELHVTHMYQVPEDQWPAVSDDFEIESDVLKSVAQFIANSTEEASVSMIADRSISSGGKLRVVEVSVNETYLEVELPFDRAWASVQIGIENSGFAIDDLNRSEGIFYVTYQGEPEEEGGSWFGWLFSDDDNPLIGQAFTVHVASVDGAIQRVSLEPTTPEAIPERGQPMLLSILKGNIN